MSREIVICRKCKIPLIWTFHWAYCEYFCINCGGHWGMLGAGKSVKETPELKSKLKSFNKLWKVLAHNLIPVANFGRKGCKKCHGCNHQEHLSKREIRANKIVVKILNNLEGCFD
jgi:hypothetical protein